jgi:hypothetical protein
MPQPDDRCLGLFRGEDVPAFIDTSDPVTD